MILKRLEIKGVIGYSFTFGTLLTIQYLKIFNCMKWAYNPSKMYTSCMVPLPVNPTFLMSKCCFTL